MNLCRVSKMLLDDLGLAPCVIIGLRNYATLAYDSHLSIEARAIATKRA